MTTSRSRGNGAASGGRVAGEPSADAIEALVRSIEAREAEADVRPARGATKGPVVRRAVVVVSKPPADRPTRPVAAPSLEARDAGRAARGTARTRVNRLLGRAEWERLLASEAARQRRYGRSNAVVLVELGGLDRAAEKAGPGVVGRVELPTAETIASIARASDRLTRLADGRFGILLREADADGARGFAARAVAACDPWLAAMPWSLELVVGWASPARGEDLAGAVRRAERRLSSAAQH